VPPDAFAHGPWVVFLQEPSLKSTEIADLLVKLLLVSIDLRLKRVDLFSHEFLLRRINPLFSVRELLLKNLLLFVVSHDGFNKPALRSPPKSAMAAQKCGIDIFAETLSEAPSMDA